MFSSRLLAFVYAAIGIAVAAANDYFNDVDTIRELVSAVLAIALWPLVLFDINLRIK